jgi:hypothetical protein
LQFAVAAGAVLISIVYFKLYFFERCALTMRVFSVTSTLLSLLYCTFAPVAHVRAVFRPIYTHDAAS